MLVVMCQAVLALSPLGLREPTWGLHGRHHLSLVGWQLLLTPLPSSGLAGVMGFELPEALGAVSPGVLSLISR